MEVPVFRAGNERELKEQHRSLTTTTTPGTDILRIWNHARLWLLLSCTYRQEVSQEKQDWLSDLSKPQGEGELIEKISSNPRLTVHD